MIINDIGHLSGCFYTKHLKILRKIKFVSVHSVYFLKEATFPETSGNKPKC